MKNISDKMIASLESNISISVNGTPVFIFNNLLFGRHNCPRGPIAICQK
ncbi:hypothetical protein QEJ31_08890 [Pigmentibacter sp. JX0631]|nr:hypothetical protein [Pigmentibacter sp. JX0631]WGL58650.1 hypothetical protein QEJ31_08890 [Pigmentibacter sp. JX0631]